MKTCTSLILVSLFFASPLFAVSSRSFQRHVASILAENYPNRKIERDDEAFLIHIDDMAFGLSLLHGRLKREDPRARLTQQLIIEYFERILKKANDDVYDHRELSWKEVAHLIRPQLITREQAQEGILTRPFTETISIGYVLDLGRMVSFTLEEDPIFWGVSQDELHRQALSNLDRLSRKIRLEVRRPSGQTANGKYIIINNQDSYDAVRLLSPKFRKRVIRRLGEPFYIGIPNRDFLICWSQDFSEQASFDRLIAEDYETQPWPLSDGRFLFSKKDGVVQITDAP